MDKIKLTYLAGIAMTFNVDDYMKIRTEHRIVGNLIGAAIGEPRNINVNGLPAIYNEYETKLLINKGYAVLVAKPELCNPETEDIKEKYLSFLERECKEQSIEMKNNKILEINAMLDKICDGKRRKLLKMGVKDEDIKLDRDKVRNEEIEKIPELHPDNALIQIPTEYPFATVIKEVTITLDDNDKKYRIFKDLWEKGKFITNGDKFGGDFLLYPGDPMYFHASHIIYILDNKLKLNINFLISCGRLSIIVNKIFTFVYIDKDNEINYQNVEWEGNVKLK